MNSTALLSFRDISIVRGGQKVLEVDALDILRGESMVVIGPNGAGKSTLLLAAAGLLPPKSGSLTKDGKEVYAGNMLAYRRQTALVLQDPLLMDMTVYENVSSGLRFRGVEKKVIDQKVNTWLEKLNIAHLKKRRARSLSGGEAQRASLARALVLDPDLLLMDEPFSALDAPSRVRLLEDFRILIHENAITTLLVTHDLNEALQLGDRVAVLLDGKLRQAGTPPEVFNAPVDADVAAFVGVDTVIPAIVTSLKDGMVSLKAGDYTLESVGDARTGSPVLLCLRPEDITLWKDGEVPLSSARNRMHGVVQRCSILGALVRVTIDCGFPVVALITRSSWMEMGIKEGQTVSASFKATAGHVLAR
jgi:tungstate transport system ATP-binding protein